MSELEEARATFSRAVDFLRAGNAPMTEQISRAALADYPGEMNFLTLLGAALIRQGQAAEALTYLQQVVDNEPDYAKGHEQLGEALLALGRAEEAIEPLQKALTLNPAFEAAQFKLGKALISLGREKDAEQVFEAFMRQAPHRQRLAEAAELHRNGEYQEAEQVYREILKQDPDNISAMRLLALLAVKLEHFRDAVVLLKQVVKLAPDFHDARLDLGHAQVELHELEDAVATMETAIRLDPSSYAARIGLANALARSSKTADALAAYEAAIASRPEIAGSYLGLGNVLKTLGRQSDAIAAYRKGIDIRPGFAEVYWSLSNLKTFRFTDDEIAAMTELLARPELSDGDAVHLSFALGKASEDARDYDAAFAYYERGNRLRRAQESYDPVHTEDIGERIREVFSPERLANARSKGFADVQPIFITGLPRSGSTLLEQILASHPMVEATHELPEGGRLIKFIDRRRAGRDRYPEAVVSMPDESLFELGKRYDDETRRYRSGAPFFIDKMPNNFANIGLLAMALPSARFIDARRHPLDTCLSCYKQLFARGQSFTYDMEELAYYCLEYRRMMDHWHAVLPDRVLTVQYEDVVADLQPQVERILAHCGLPWDDACLDFHNTERAIRTASSEQVRLPLYRDAVAYWKNFDKALIPLKEILGPVLEN
jgi:tetratricopeptide (TPR) repeat protein